jgi:hypothetical protein
MEVGPTNRPWCFSEISGISGWFLAKDGSDASHHFVNTSLGDMEPDTEKYKTCFPTTFGTIMKFSRIYVFPQNNDVF